ncbi:preprotein translocase subunit SecG [Thiohalobacter sp. IOR34]|uniref:preprotein translocase subunit SecG n=1 Tax=Thiohalobacter sp. IOR34 TaxID=3057176 RepID=UPI0025B23D18|nr:preprotein translocase subunit SecG [Thiohalobacter sp. IOR34]WJW76469.1 preprotein translocase subunit SecG [Thiohalobacter sp. IOR34]
MYSILLVFQVLLAIGVIVLVLLQHGKGADAGAAFGSGASATVFGAQGSGNFLSRSTAILAALFFANSLLLSSEWVLGDRRAPASVAEQLAPAVNQVPAETPAAKKQEATDLPPADLPPADGAAGAGSDLPN